MLGWSSWGWVSSKVSRRWGLPAVVHRRESPSGWWDAGVWKSGSFALQRQRGRWAEVGAGGRELHNEHSTSLAHPKPWHRCLPQVAVAWQRVAYERLANIIS